LNRLPIVKAFLKGTDADTDTGGADSYEGVTIEWIRGKRPIMTIYEDGVKREEVDLSQYNDSIEGLNALMVEKGFHKKRKREEAAGEAGKVVLPVAAESKASVVVVTTTTTSSSVTPPSPNSSSSTGTGTTNSTLTLVSAAKAYAADATLRIGKKERIELGPPRPITFLESSFVNVFVYLTGATTIGGILMYVIIARNRRKNERTKQ